MNYSYKDIGAVFKQEKLFIRPPKGCNEFICTITKRSDSNGDYFEVLSEIIDYDMIDRDKGLYNFCTQKVTRKYYENGDVENC